jgi:hypothetical protein
VSETGHIITEYAPSGNLTFEARFDPYTYPTYAAYRTKWDHAFFRLSSDSVNFGDVIQGESVYQDVNVINLTNKTITITAAYGHNRGFKIQNLPLTIAPLKTGTIKVEFRTVSLGKVSDVLTLCQETDSTITARPLFVSGKSVLKTGIENETVPDIELYPNPAKDILGIKSHKMMDYIKIYYLSGRIIKTINNPMNSIKIEIEAFDPGFYILEIVFSDKTKSVKGFVKQ